MKFTKGQKQVLDLIEKSKGFLHLFPLMRVIIQDKPLSDQYDIVHDCVNPYVELTKKFVVNIRAFFKEVRHHNKGQYHLLCTLPSLAEHFNTPNQLPETKKIKELLPKILEFLDDAELDFQWNDLDKFSEKDDTEEFWADAVGYYTQSVCFEEFSPEKAKASLANQLKLGQLQTLIDPNNHSFVNWYGKMQVVLAAARAQERQEQKHRHNPERLEEKITAVFKELYDPIFDAELKQHQPGSSMRYAAPLIIVTVVASLYIIYLMKEDLRFGIAASIVIGFLAKLGVWDKAVVSRLQIQQTAYKGYLQQKFDRVAKEFEDNTRLQRIHVIEVTHEEKRVPEIKHLCVIPAQLKHFSIANNEKEEKKEIAAESGSTKTVGHLKRRNRPSPAEAKEAPKTQLAKSTNLIPEEIEFKLDDGRSFKINPKILPKESPIKTIHDGTGTLWGFLDEEKLGDVDKTEMGHFRNILTNGTYVSKYVHGKEGVKQQGDHTYIYDAKAEKSVPSYTKLRPSGIGARVASQRFFATRVMIGGQALENPKRYRLDCFDTYFTAKEAHRPG